MWYSIDVRQENQAVLQDSNAGDWYWARKDARAGLPPSAPRYLEWSKDQWKRWIESNREKRLERPVVELWKSQLANQAPLSVTDGGVRRNLRRAVRDARNRDDISYESENDG